MISPAQSVEQQLNTSDSAPQNLQVLYEEVVEAVEDSVGREGSLCLS